jgi:hypothetical protein
MFHGTQVDGGPSPQAAAVDRLWRVVMASVFRRWWPEAGSGPAGRISSTARGMRAVVGPPLVTGGSAAPWNRRHPRRSISCRFHRSRGSLDRVSNVVHLGSDDFSLGGCRPSLARRRRQPKWWGRLRGPWAGVGVHLIVVTCSGLAVALASMAEGETAWRLLGWEEPHGAVWLRRSVGCGR